MKSRTRLVVAGLAAVSASTMAGQAVAQCSVEVPFEMGWNLVCIPHDPADPTLTEVLQPLIDAGTLEQVCVYDGDSGSWLRYATALPPELNDPLDVLDLHAGDGFWIRVTHAAILEVPVSYADATTDPAPILSEGWNLIGLGMQDPRTWDMVFGGHAGDEVARVAMFDAVSESFLNLEFPEEEGEPPVVDTHWLQPSHGLWVDANLGFTLEPPEASNILVALFSGAGIASGFEPSWYNEYTFESAGFDIDRPPIGCTGDEDTDAWTPDGDRSETIDGDPGPDGWLAEPVEGRYKMLINIGSQIAAPDPSNPGAVNPLEQPWRVYGGGLSLFMAANRPNIEP